MTPEEYEHYVADVLRAEGWAARVTSYSSDAGIDVIAERGEQRLGVQAKMYGTARKVNAAQVRELVGAAQFADCTSALIVTDGELLETAWDTAKKLNVEVRFLPVPAAPRDVEFRGPVRSQPTTHAADGSWTFGRVWQDHVLPLAGRTISTRGQGRPNEILRVDDGGLTRRTSSGATQYIEIEIFRWTVERLLRSETVSREEINEKYPKRASSGVLAVVCALPLFEEVPLGRGIGVRMRHVPR